MKPTKTPYHLVDFGFVAEVADTLRKGIKDGRKKDDWQSKHGYEDEYFSALIRHAVASDWPAVAANAMILWWFSKHPKRKTECMT